jgi:hypothetical protein
MEGTGKPQYDKCVAISTQASIKKMMLPGAIAIVSPVLIGFTMGPEALGGFLAGATVSGVLMGMFQNNAGGAWDNAKKSFEKGANINGVMYYKKSEPHKASVTGDTVGDPFKDTSGPSMNILIKLMSIVSLVIAPSLAQIASHDVSVPSGIEQLQTPAPTPPPIGSVGATQPGVGGLQPRLPDPNDLDSDAELIDLGLLLEEEGVYDKNTQTLMLYQGHVYVDGKPIEPTLEVKYAHLINEITRVQKALEEANR